MTAHNPLVLMALVETSVFDGGTGAHETRGGDEMRSPVDLIRAIFEEAWSRGASAFLQEEIGEVVFHYGGQQRELTGRELRDVIEAWRAGFPDLTFEIQDLVEQDERVAVRARLCGTHEGDWRGVPATGRAFDIGVMMFFRFAGERLVEIWEVDDALTRDRQLGLR